MSQTYLANACPEHPLTADRRITPVLTADGQPRVRHEFATPFPGAVPSDYFPNAARDLAAALTKHAREAEDMACIEQRRKDEAARIKRLEATKPHCRAVQVGAEGDIGGIYWIWCLNNGEFRYTWPGSGLVGTPFTPGKDFPGVPAFKATPEHIALWTKLAYDAGQEAF